MRRRAAEAGFTLLELLIVVALVAVLSLVAMPEFAGMIRVANEGATKGKLGSIRSALTLYYSDTEGSYPADLTPLTQPGSKYLTQVVPVFTANHGSSSAVDVVAAFDPSADGGGFGYVGSGGDWGRVWVECTHADEKGRVWSAF